MVDIINGIDDGTNRVSAVVLLAPGTDPIRVGVRGQRPTTITYAGSTWTMTKEMAETDGGHLAYCYRQSSTAPS
jgi:hypothetical protein